MACVYALVLASAPEDYRYIGRTNERPARRLSKHLTAARTGEDSYVYRWMRKAMAEGQALDLIVLEDDMTFEESGFREIALIAEYRAKGYRLTNISAGGDGSLGNSGWKHTEEALAKMRGNKHKLGFKDSPETREKKRLSALGNKSNTGRKASEEARANMRAAQARRTPEELKAAKEKARITRANRTPEEIQRERENRSKARKGEKRGPWSPETREKVMAARAAAKLKTGISNG
jgi:hypothetical protein